MSATQSPSQTIGPMYGYALYAKGMNRSTDPDEPGAVLIRGAVLDGEGEPVAHPDALVEVWLGDQFTRARTDAFGVWHVWVRKPEGGLELPDGTTLAPYLHATVWARGLMKQAETRIYFPDEAAANAADPVLARVPENRRHTLVAVPEDDGSLRFDIRLQGENETVFFDF
ncbi:protocatechuate 3,4-dioxygenase subunit alpha [Streptomyces sp. NPDC085946]|uniref:protocatechuate 3,4-dioxygenase subunit alpha n=1 Tax=Streptomyces sp. NPDC085946 TaxID=3365744 RepID=UPI0037CCD193